MGGGCDDDGVVGLRFVQCDFTDACDKIQKVSLRVRIDIRIALIGAVATAGLLRLADLLERNGRQNACANDFAPTIFDC